MTHYQTNELLGVSMYGTLEEISAACAKIGGDFSGITFEASGYLLMAVDQDGSRQVAGIEAEVKTCRKCEKEYTLYPNDTAQSGEAFGYPDFCWSCGFDGNFYGGLK